VIIDIAYTFGTSSPGRNGVKTSGYAQRTPHRDPVRFYGGFKAIKTFSSVCDLSFPDGSAWSRTNGTPEWSPEKKNPRYFLCDPSLVPIEMEILKKKRISPEINEPIIITLLEVGKYLK